MLARPGTRGSLASQCQLWSSVAFDGRMCFLVLKDLQSCCDTYHALTGAAAASTGAAPTAEAGQEGASPADSEFGSPQPGSEFAPEQPMDGDLGGDDFDFGQTGVLHS